MKKTLITLFTLLTIVGSGRLFAQAENYQMIRVDGAFIFAMAPGELNAYGVGGMFSPKFMITDNISAGLRFEGDALFGANIDPSGSANVGVMAVAAYLVKGEYYFNQNGSSTRPFAGLGMGLYSLAAVSGGGSSSGSGGAAIEAGNSFGLQPMVGINLGPVRLGLSYNWILTRTEVEITVGQVEKISRNYLGLDLGFTIGGAPK